MNNYLLRLLISIYLVLFCSFCIAQIPHANGWHVIINGSKWTYNEDKVANTCELKSCSGEVYTGHITFPDKIIVNRYVGNDEVIEVPLTVVSVWGSYNHSDMEMNVESLTFPSSVKKIRFYKPPMLRSITTMGSIESIYFGECENLETIIFGGSVSTFEEGAFSFCKKIREIIIPGSVGSIEERAFRFCSSLETVTFLSSLQKIGNEAFYCCKKLKKINLPNSVTEIGERAFNSCESLETIQIPSSVRKMGDCAFWSCTGLKSATIAGNIGNYAFENSKSLHTLTLQEGVEEIGKSAFVSDEITFLTIPKTVKRIGDFTFKFKGLKGVVFNGSPLEMSTPFFNVGSMEKPCKLMYPNDWKFEPIDDSQLGYDYKYGGYFVKTDNLVAMMEPFVGNTDITFSDKFDEETSLDGLVEGSMYYSLQEKQGDGFNKEEGCLIIKTPMTLDQIAETTGSIASAESSGESTGSIAEGESTGSVAQGNGIPDFYTGLVAFAGGGESCGSVGLFDDNYDGESTGSIASESVGSIAFDFQTQGSHQLNVKFGNEAPITISSAERTTATIPFKLKDDTFILIYASSGNVSAASPTRSISVPDNCVKLYGIKFNIDEIIHIDTNGIEAQQKAEGVEKWYSLNGMQIQSLQHGINILRMPNGHIKKVIVK